MTLLAKFKEWAGAGFNALPDSPRVQQWFTCVLLEYEGHKTYRVGLVHKDTHEIEWVTGLPFEYAIETISDNQRRVLRSDRRIS